MTGTITSKTGLDVLDSKILEWNSDGREGKRECSLAEIEKWNALPGECNLEITRKGDKFSVCTATDYSTGHVVLYSQPYRSHWIDFGADFHAAIRFGLRVLGTSWDQAIEEIES